MSTKETKSFETLRRNPINQHVVGLSLLNKPQYRKNGPQFYALHHIGFQPEYAKLFPVGLIYAAIFRLGNSALLIYPFFWGVGGCYDVLVQSQVVTEIIYPAERSLVLVRLATAAVFWTVYSRKEVGPTSIHQAIPIVYLPGWPLPWKVCSIFPALTFLTNSSGTNLRPRLFWNWPFTTPVPPKFLKSCKKLAACVKFLLEERARGNEANFPNLRKNLTPSSQLLNNSPLDSSVSIEHY